MGIHHSPSRLTDDTPGAIRAVGAHGIARTEQAPHAPGPAVRAVSQAAWMERVDGKHLLSALTIPGTHDTCALYGGPITVTQTLSLREQLEAGIRFLDIRCRHIGNRFAIHHGPVYQRVMFDTVRDVCQQFLTEHPSECIVMSVNREYREAKCTRPFEATFDHYLNGHRHFWYLSNRIPHLDAVRGKIVLFRRFAAKSAAAPPRGIDASAGWLDSATFDIRKNGVTLKIQDNYVVPSLGAIAEKWRRVHDHMEAARAGDPSAWFVDFASGTSDATPLAVPAVVAKGALRTTGVNTHLARYLEQHPQGRLGTVLLDFPEYPEGKLPGLLIAANGV